MRKGCLSRAYTRTHTEHSVLQGRAVAGFSGASKARRKKKTQEQKKRKKKSKETKINNSIYTCIFTYRKSKEMFMTLSLK